MLPPPAVRLAATALLFLTACSGGTTTPLADAPAAPPMAATATALPAYPGFRPIPEASTPPPPYRPAPGTRVVDADTVDFDDARYRLHGIDAPESRQTCRTWGLTWSCGAAATQALATHAGTLACSGTETDRYGRVIGVCSAGGIDLNAWLVASGWALAYRRYADDCAPRRCEGEVLMM